MCIGIVDPIVMNALFTNKEMKAKLKKSYNNRSNAYSKREALDEEGIHVSKIDLIFYR